MSCHALPEHLQQWLDGWGPHLRKRLSLALAQSGCQPILHPGMALRLGTDCSGIEAPVHALNTFEVPHRHCWSSEVATGPRDISLANTAPEVLFKNVLAQEGLAPGSRFTGSRLTGSRSTKATRTGRCQPEYVDLYVSGLHSASSTMERSFLLSQRRRSSGRLFTASTR